MGIWPYTLAAVRREHARYSAILGHERPLATTPQHDGSAHAERWFNWFHYVRTERGAEYERRRTRDERELLYWLLGDLTFQLACDFEVRNRRHGEDFRRQLFTKQLEYFGALEAAWAVRCRAEQTEILKDHPFNDGLPGVGARPPNGGW